MSGMLPQKHSRSPSATGRIPRAADSRTCSTVKGLAIGAIGLALEPLARRLPNVDLRRPERARNEGSTGPISRTAQDFTFQFRVSSAESRVSVLVFVQRVSSFSFGC